VDPVCHTLTGAALGKAGLARRTPLGMGTLLIAANLPDVDVAVYATDTLVVSFRRGWTHGVLAQAALPLLLAAVMLACDHVFRARRTAGGRLRSSDGTTASSGPARASFSQLALLAYIGVISHVFLDWLNTYGVRLLMPFSERWFYGDALFIVDPWMYVTLGLGVWLSARRERRGDGRPWQPARVALTCAAIYVAAMLASNLVARAVVRDGLMRAGQPATTRFMVTPVFVNPFSREVIADVGDRYEKGFLWFEPVPHFRPAGYGVNKGVADPEVGEAMRQARAQAYLRWSRFPFFVVDRGVSPPRVLLNDYRYSDAAARAGWAGLAIAIEP
jgi:inner membrane protein